MKKFFFVVALLTLAACAAGPETNTDTREERVYVTGSNLPKKDRKSSGVQTVDKEALERDLGRQSMPMPAPGSPR